MRNSKLIDITRKYISSNRVDQDRRAESRLVFHNGLPFFIYKIAKNNVYPCLIHQGVLFVASYVFNQTNRKIKYRAEKFNSIRSAVKDIKQYSLEDCIAVKKTIDDYHKKMKFTQ